MSDWFSVPEDSSKESSSQKDEKKQNFRLSVASIPEYLPEESIKHHDELPHTTRRSPLICRNGCVASSQPLASSIGLDMLRKGANAAEAAIAVSAALCVTEPCSCGLGGDMFCLYYEAATKKVTAINGSGRSPGNLTLEQVRRDCKDPVIDLSRSVHSVTVPGTARGWEDLFRLHGSGNFSFSELLEPAAKLAEEGFPVQTITASSWSNGGRTQIAKWIPPGEPIPLTVDGTNFPEPGDVVTNPDLAGVLRRLGDLGAEEGFYKGETGNAIVETVQKHGGVMTMEDLANHTSAFPEPLSVDYHGVTLWEVPPAGQGIAALIALKGVEAIEKNENYTEKEDPWSLESYHKMIEMMRLGFADARAHVADLDHMKVSCEALLNPSRLYDRATSLFDPNKGAIQGVPDASSCTVSFQVVDKEGNAISFVNSNFMGFGTGIVPKGCGFTLQNRGFGFTVANGDEDHPNVLGPSKRPLHTILPGMLTHTHDGTLYATLSNMGGNMQPQGHLQLSVHMIRHGLDPQAAIDMPRFCIADGTQGGKVLMEKEVPPSVVQELKDMGHTIKSNIHGPSRAFFGKAQIIKKDPRTGVLWAGSEGRADGCAMGY